jgi:hypothetical protein
MGIPLSSILSPLPAVPGRGEEEAKLSFETVSARHPYLIKTPPEIQIRFDRHHSSTSWERWRPPSVPHCGTTEDGSRRRVDPSVARQQAGETPSVAKAMEGTPALPEEECFLFETF